MSQTLSPAQLLLLIHIYAIPGVHQSSPVNDSTIEEWLQDEIIEPAPGRKGEYRTTPKGSKWLTMICETPRPISLWCDPREKK